MEKGPEIPVIKGCQFCLEKREDAGEESKYCMVDGKKGDRRKESLGYFITEGDGVKSISSGPATGDKKPAILDCPNLTVDNVASVVESNGVIPPKSIIFAKQS